MLVPWNEGGKKGKQKAPSGGGTVYVNRLPKEDLPVLASAQKLREPRTAADIQHNREIMRGVLKPNAAASVLNVVNAGSGASGAAARPPSPDADGDASGGDGGDVGGDEGLEFVQIAADAEAHLPTGWIHNRRVVDVELLLRACEEASPKPLSADSVSYTHLTLPTILLV